jgi:hypothetical protein
MASSAAASRIHTASKPLDDATHLTFAEKQRRAGLAKTEDAKLQARAAGAIAAAGGHVAAGKGPILAPPGARGAATSAPAAKAAKASAVLRTSLTGAGQPLPRVTSLAGGGSASSKASSVAALVAAGTTRPQPTATAASGAAGKPKKAAGAAGSSSSALSSAALQAMLRMESSHRDEAAESVRAQAAAHVASLEQLEAMEGRMKEANAMERTAWCCMDCEKFFDKKPAACEAEGHSVVVRKRKQWAFKCAHCSHRTFHPSEVCVKPCPNCGKQAWESTSIYALRGERAAAGAAAKGTSVDPTLEVRAEGAHGNDILVDGRASFAQGWGADGGGAE